MSEVGLVGTEPSTPHLEIIYCVQKMGGGLGLNVFKLKWIIGRIMVEIGLTDLPKSGGAMVPSAPPGTTGPIWECRLPPPYRLVSPPEFKRFRRTWSTFVAYYLWVGSVFCSTECRDSLISEKKLKHTPPIMMIFQQSSRSYRGRSTYTVSVAAVRQRFRVSLLIRK